MGADFNGLDNSISADFNGLDNIIKNTQINECRLQ